MKPFSIIVEFIFHCKKLFKLISLFDEEIWFDYWFLDKFEIATSIKVNKHGEIIQKGVLFLFQLLSLVNKNI